MCRRTPFSSDTTDESQTYKLLEAFLPRIRVLVLLRADLIEPARLRVHHGTRVLKHLHVQPLPSIFKSTKRKISACCFKEGGGENKMHSQVFTVSEDRPEDGVVGELAEPLADAGCLTEILLQQVGEDL